MLAGLAVLSGLAIGGLATTPAVGSSAAKHTRCSAPRAIAHTAGVLVYRKQTDVSDYAGNDELGVYACERPGGSSYFSATTTSTTKPSTARIISSSAHAYQANM